MLLKLRRENPVLHQGNINFMENVPEDVIDNTRKASKQRILVALNFGENTYEVFPDEHTGTHK